MKSLLFNLLMVSTVLAGSATFKVDSSCVVNGLKTNRFYYSAQTGTKIKVDSLLIKSFNGTTPKYWRVKVDSTGVITTDSAGVN